MRINHLSRMYKGTYKNCSLFVLALVCIITLAGCVPKFAEPIHPKLYPSGSAYIYQPLNPTTVWVRDVSKNESEEGDRSFDITSPEFNKALLRDLDTETVRIALNTFSGDLNFNAAVVGTSVKGESYVLIVDYIKYVTSSWEIDTEYTAVNTQGQEISKRFVGTVPMYTGIGLRVRAEFKALKGGLNISGLPAIAVAANTGGINGRLTVQTLGITGREVTGLMPLISDISVASIQTALQSVAAIKSKIYEESTTVYPKIVGFESPSQDPSVIMAITKVLYGTEFSICPKVSKDPMDKTKDIYWIDWTLSGEGDENESPGEVNEDG